jgi:tryptophanyl-tRNA synthetase
MYSPIEMELAHEIAERLNDPDSLTQYLKYAKQYPHSVLRRKLEYVCSLPDRKITHSRGAYFIFLVEQQLKGNKDRRNDTYSGH